MRQGTAFTANRCVFVDGNPVSRELILSTDPLFSGGWILGCTGLCGHYSRLPKRRPETRNYAVAKKSPTRPEHGLLSPSPQKLVPPCGLSPWSARSKGR